MEQIVWNATFSVGVKSMDMQHKQIIRMINQLIADPEATVRSETISDLLSQLMNYSREHFNSEEKILRKYNYEGLDEQCKDHKAYLMKVVGLCQDTMEFDRGVPVDLLRFIKDWWETHILVDDMKYKSFMEKQQ